MPRETQFMNQLLSRFSQVEQMVRQAPIMLGGSTGSGGGGGGPPGGFIGRLPQGQITGDTDELAVVSSGSIGSLLDNLNRIRYWEKTQIAASEPSPTFAGQLWVDTASSNALNIRNETDTDWYTYSSSSPVNSQAVFSVEGVVSAGTGTLRLYNSLGRTVTISKVFMAVGTAPVGSSIICDLNVNGTTVFTNQSNRPTITAGNNTGYTTSIDSASWIDGAYLTLDRDAVGSGTPGSDLSVNVVYS